MTDSLRDRIAAVLFMRDDEAQSCWNRGYAELPAEIQELWRVEADPVIAALPEMRRLEQIRKVCIASLDLDRMSQAVDDLQRTGTVGDSLTDRAWLAEAVLNILNGAVDE